MWNLLPWKATVSVASFPSFLLEGITWEHQWKSAGQSVTCTRDSTQMVAKHSCCFKSSDFFLLGGRYFLILTLGSLYTVWIIKFPLLMEENLVVNATCLFLLSGSCLCRPAPKPEITYRPLCAFRYQEDGEAFESPPLISADDYFHRVLHALTTSPRHWEGHRLVQLGWSLDPLLKYLPPRWWALAKIPLFSSEETSWPGQPVNDCRKELTPLLQSGWNQEMSDFAPSPFSIRETWILTQARWFSGAWVHHLLCQLTFSIKSLFLFPTSRLSTYWPVGWWTVWVWTAEQSCIW